MLTWEVKPLCSKRITEFTDSDLDLPSPSNASAVTLSQKDIPVQPMLIPACAVGAPHRRDRIFIIAHSNSHRRREIHKHLQCKLSDGTKSFCDGWFEITTNPEELHGNGGPDRYGGDGAGQEVSQLGGRDSEAAAYTESQRGERCRADNKARGEEKEQSGRIGGESITRMLPEERWEGFPTVSPVHRGNDGLPFDVDNLTISFAKWRKESLKAYGNAIVPQVMYRIFQCIEKI